MSVNFSEINLSNPELNGFNVKDELKHCSVEEIQKIANQDRLPFSIACLSITGDLNVGSIIRSAHLFGAREAFVIGRRKIDRRSLVGMQNYMTIHRFEGLNFDNGEVNIDPHRVFEIFKDNNLYPIMVETGGHPVGDVDWSELFSHEGTPCFVFGNETNGISPEVQEILKTKFNSYTIEIPQRGVGRSFNVAAAAAVVMGIMVDKMKWW